MPRKYVPKTDRKNGKHKVQDVPADYTPGFMAKLDQRTEIARMLRDRFDGLAVDLGGIGKLSGIQASLLERFTFLEATLGKLECDMAKAVDAKATSEVMARWIQACNALLGIGRALGLERQAKPIDLQTYINADGAGGTDK